jgi:hypothetical protein
MPIREMYLRTCILETYLKDMLLRDIYTLVIRISETRYLIDKNKKVALIITKKILL